MADEKKKKLLVVTGGGDCPGLNAVIRAVVRHAILHYGWEVIGSEDAFNGILDEPRRIRPLDLASVSGILPKGGTILGTTNRGDPFSYPMPRNDGSGEFDLVDRSQDVIDFCREEGVDCLVVIGGDGSARIAQRFSQEGLPIVVVPKTIDNDLACTDYTFGFLTAVATATDAVDKLHTTAESHDRVMVLEVMGRDAGWIALASGIAGGADFILIPEVPYDIEKVAEEIRRRVARQGRWRTYALLVVAEGARPKDGTVTARLLDEPGYKLPKLGGVGLLVSEELHRLTGMDTRYTVLGHLQRGGSPSAFDRILASEFGVAAVELVAEERYGHMVALRTPDIVAVPLADAIASQKLVDPRGAMMKTARGLGIGFGD